MTYRDEPRWKKSFARTNRWIVRLALAASLIWLAAGCRSAPPSAPPPAAEAPVPAGPLCEAQGPPIAQPGQAEGWSFCVQQKADCLLANAAEAVRLRWCEQSPLQKCVDTGCLKYRGGECRFGIGVPSGVELTATPPRNDLCGARWECRVRTPRYDFFQCTGLCSDPARAASASGKPFVTLAEGDYAIVAVWADSLCPNGQMHLSAYDGESFTLVVKDKCLPADLKLRAVFAPSGGAFFAVGEAPAERDLFHLSGVVEDPDAFTAILTRTNSVDDQELERVRITGRRMTTPR